MTGYLDYRLLLVSFAPERCFVCGGAYPSFVTKSLYKGKEYSFMGGCSNCAYYHHRRNSFFSELKIRKIFTMSFTTEQRGRSSYLCLYASFFKKNIGTVEFVSSQAGRNRDFCKVISWDHETLLSEQFLPDLKKIFYAQAKFNDFIGRAMMEERGVKTISKLRKQTKGYVK